MKRWIYDRCNFIISTGLIALHGEKERGGGRGGTGEDRGKGEGMGRREGREGGLQLEVR